MLNEKSQLLNSIDYYLILANPPKKTKQTKKPQKNKTQTRAARKVSSRVLDSPRVCSTQAQKKSPEKHIRILVAPISGGRLYRWFSLSCLRLWLSRMRVDCLGPGGHVQPWPVSVHELRMAPTAFTFLKGIKNKPNAGACAVETIWDP